MYVKDILDHFKKEYGADYLQHYFAWQNAHKAQAGKALQTAQSKGDKIVKSLAKTKKGKERARKEGM